MNQNDLKTSPKQRIIISLIAIIMLASTIASYIAIVLSSNKNTSPQSKISSAKVAEYQALLSEKSDQLKSASAPYFKEMLPHKSRVTAYNEATANSGGLQTVDLKLGTGLELASGNTNYLAYYVGWCADETVFDSSFDDPANPTAFKSVLDASAGLIKGWELGVIGMKLGGIRELTIPGELAYGETREICGGKNKPLKFIVMALENSGPLAEIAKAYALARTKVQYASYGLDYDAIMNQSGDQ